MNRQGVKIFDVILFLFQKNRNFLRQCSNMSTKRQKVGCQISSKQFKILSSSIKNDSGNIFCHITKLCLQSYRVWLYNCFQTQTKHSSIQNRKTSKKTKFGRFNLHIHVFFKVHCIFRVNFTLKPMVFFYKMHCNM